MPIKSKDCNQPVTGSDALGAVHGMKTDDILIDKPELAAGVNLNINRAVRFQYGSVLKHGTSSGDSWNDVRQQQQGSDAFQKKDIVVENDGLLADSECDSQNNSENPVAITSTSQEPESSSIPANSVMRSSSTGNPKDVFSAGFKLNTGTLMQHKNLGSSSKEVVPGGMSGQWRKFSANLFRPKTTALIYLPRFMEGSRMRSVASGTKPKPQWCPAGLTHTQKRRVQRLRA